MLQNFILIIETYFILFISLSKYEIINRRDLKIHHLATSLATKIHPLQQPFAACAGSSLFTFLSDKLSGGSIFRTVLFFNQLPVCAPQKFGLFIVFAFFLPPPLSSSAQNSSLDISSPYRICVDIPISAFCVASVE